MIDADRFVEARRCVLDGENVTEDYVYALIEKFPHANDLRVLNDMMNLLSVMTCVTEQSSLAASFNEAFLVKPPFLVQ